ncbi:hypothetical protein [Humibacter ginsengiterrae]
MFLLFAAVGVIAILFMARFIRETRGRSLEEFGETYKTGAFSPVRARRAG